MPQLYIVFMAKALNRLRRSHLRHQVKVLFINIIIIVRQHIIGETARILDFVPTGRNQTDRASVCSSKGDQ